MATRQPEPDSLVEDLRTDLRRFHEKWMGLVFPRQVGAADTALGKWRPTTRGERIRYRTWGALGAGVVGVLYPVVLVGAVVRFHVRRIDAAAAYLGALGVLVLAGVVWGGLSLVARARFSYEGFVAVAAAGSVATVSAVGALFFRRVGGRITTVVFAYPLAVTAFLLPPVVAALYSPVLANVVFAGTDTVAVWLLKNAIPPRVAGPLTRYFDLVGLAYVLVWFAVAVPLGWLLGVVVTLADVVRPK
jgi:hypothetical protein